MPLISPLFHYFKVFYAYTGIKIYALMLIIFSAGLFEGLGISIIIPLLSFENTANADNRYSQFIFDFLDASGFGTSLASILSLFILLFFLKGLFTIVMVIFSAAIKTQIEKDMKAEFCHKYTTVRYDYFIQKPIGYFNNLISTEINTAVSGLNNYLNVIVTLTHILIYLSSAVLINLQLTVLVLVTSGTFFLLLKRLPRLLKKISILITQTNAETQSLIIQKLYNFKYLKATSAFSTLLEQITQKIELYRKYQLKSAILNGLPNSLIEFFIILFLSVLIWYYVEMKQFRISEIAVLLIFFYRSLGRILNLQNAWQRFSSYIGAIDIIKKEKAALTAHAESVGKIRIQDFKKEIKLTHVNFAYEDKQVLFDINIQISKNRCIGIVGHSGSGKTTLFDLLTGLIPTNTGTISIDDIDYQDIDFTPFRKQLGYVTQEPVIFNDTIANNISMWAKGEHRRTYDRIIESANLSDCMSFIQECPQGLETVIGEKGVRLSGGQRQRIAIAREIYKNPQIMIFDEATSSLDTESELSIQNSIATLKGSKTMVLIAHRLSTIRDCDYIYVLSQGRIVEEGAFKDLCGQKEGHFREMCLAQKII